MSTTLTAPPAGWYPSPDGSHSMWWWDGARWTAPADLHAEQRRMTDGLAKLSVVTQILLIACGVVSIATIGVEVFGLGVAASVLAGDFSAARLLTSYEVMTAVANILSGLVVIATAVFWVIWQYRAARLVPGQTRRSPGWQVGSWFVPVVSFWFPYQNVSDLWRAVGRTRPSWQMVWWALWISGSTFIWIASQSYRSAVALDQFQVAMCVNILGQATLLAAVPFAVLVVRGITRGIRGRH